MSISKVRSHCVICLAYQKCSLEHGQFEQELNIAYLQWLSDTNSGENCDFHGWQEAKGSGRQLPESRYIKCNLRLQQTATFRDERGQPKQAQGKENSRIDNEELRNAEGSYKLSSRPEPSVFHNRQIESLALMPPSHLPTFPPNSLTVYEASEVNTKAHSGEQESLIAVYARAGR